MLPSLTGMCSGMMCSGAIVMRSHGDGPVSRNFASWRAQSIADDLMYAIVPVFLATQWVSFRFVCEACSPQPGGGRLEVPNVV